MPSVRLVPLTRKHTPRHCTLRGVSSPGRVSVRVGSHGAPSGSRVETSPSLSHCPVRGLQRPPPSHCSSVVQKGKHAGSSGTPSGCRSHCPVQTKPSRHAPGEPGVTPARQPARQIPTRPPPLSPRVRHEPPAPHAPAPRAPAPRGRGRRLGVHCPGAEGRVAEGALQRAAHRVVFAAAARHHRAARVGQRGTSRAGTTLRSTETTSRVGTGRSVTRIASGRATTSATTATSMEVVTSRSFTEASAPLPARTTEPPQAERHDRMSPVSRGRSEVMAAQDASTATRGKGESG